MPSPGKKRFRPSSIALSGTRPYQKPSPSGTQRPRSHISATAAASTGIEPPKSGQRRKKWSTTDSKGGRFIRKHAGGRLATHACELTLMHLVSAFAVEAGAAAAAEAAARSTSSSASASVGTEEGDMRKALARLLGQAPLVPNASSRGNSNRARAAPALPMHPSLLQQAPPAAGPT